LYVLITNWAMSVEDTNKFIVDHNNVINKQNICEYCTTTFSSFSIFDDIIEDDDHQKNIIRPDFSLSNSMIEEKETELTLF